MFVLTKKLIDYIEANTDFSFNYDEEDKCATFERTSSAGQDFFLEFYLEDIDNFNEFKQYVYQRYLDFDVSEETMLWVDEFGHGKNGAPHELEDVLNDMKECEKSILNLYNVINDFDNPKAYANPSYKEYYVTAHITGTRIFKVLADSLESALKKAEMEFTEADFGELEDIEYTANHVEDNIGNRLWEKD